MIKLKNVLADAGTYELIPRGTTHVNESSIAAIEEYTFGEGKDYTELVMVYGRTITVRESSEEILRLIKNQNKWYKRLLRSL